MYFILNLQQTSQSATFSDNIHVLQCIINSTCT